MWAFIQNTSTCSNKFLLYSDPCSVSLIHHLSTIPHTYIGIIIGNGTWWICIFILGGKHCRMQIMQILRDLDELRMKNIGTFSPDEGSALLLSQSGSIDRAAEAKLEAWSWSTCWSPAWLTHSPVYSGKISIELFIWLLSHHSIWYYWSILFDLYWWIIDRVLEAGVVYLLELLTGAVIFRKQN